MWPAKCNKIALNVGKTEIILLRNSRKVVNYELKVKTIWKATLLN